MPSLKTESCLACVYITLWGPNAHKEHLSVKGLSAMSIGRYCLVADGPMRVEASQR